MSANTSLFVTPVVATTAITVSRFVTVAGAQTGAAGNALGVARTTDIIGNRVPVDVIGTSIVEAGAAIAAGALVEADASGRAVTHSAGVVLGRLMPGESASAAGNLIEILLIQN